MTDAKLVLTGNGGIQPQELSDAEVNHLRRLLAWLSCQYNLSEDGQRGFMIGLQKAVENGVDINRAQEVLDEEARRIAHVPNYIRQAVKMLTKAVRDHDAETRIIDATRSHGKEPG